MRALTEKASKMEVKEESATQKRNEHTLERATRRQIKGVPVGKGGMACEAHTFSQTNADTPLENIKPYHASGNERRQNQVAHFPRLAQCESSPTTDARLRNATKMNVVIRYRGMILFAKDLSPCRCDSVGRSANNLCRCARTVLIEESG